MKLVLNALTAGALASTLTCASAQPIDAWVSTHTQRFDPTTTAFDAAALKSDEPIHVAVTLQVRDKAGLDALVSDRLAGRTTRRLTSAEFLARHAPHVRDAQAVATHLRQAGFTNVKVANNRMLVSADGTPAAVAKAFNTELRHVVVDGRDAYANVSDASVPAALGPVVGSVLGLQSVAHARSMNRRADVAMSAVGQRLPHDAEDFPALYGADSLPAATDSTIAIVAVGNLTIALNDLASFTALKGWPAANVEVVQPSGDATDFIDVEEWNLDSQASLAAAGGQVGQMLFYNAPDYSDAALQAAWNAAVAENRAQTISVSLGECEQYAGVTGFLAASDTTFEIAVAQGQTFAVASGDTGSWECGEAHNGVSYPASSPWVLAVGGSTLITTNDFKTWVNEKGWSCDTRITCAVYGGAGGGASVAEPVPAWQAGLVGTKGKGKTRHIPDVSFDADPLTGMNLFLRGHIDGTIGGTSLAAPIFAGLWTRIQSAHHNSLGFPAAGLYGMGNAGADVFHDITVGTNGTWNAKKGWDDVTGFGSFDAARLSAFIDLHPEAFGQRP